MASSFSMLSISFIVIAYLLGSISAAIVTCKLLGHEDPRTTGSFNPGTTNVLRTAGKKAAILTLLGDILKGLLPVFLAKQIDLSDLVVILTGIAAFLGHLYPVFLDFKGGKGVATALGVYLGLNPVSGIVIILCWIISALLFNISSLSALIATALAPLLFYLVTKSTVITAGMVVITLLIYWRHKVNIRDLLNGTEGKIRT